MYEAVILDKDEYKDEQTNIVLICIKYYRTGNSL